MSSLALLLENETWTPVEAPEEFQQLADQLSHATSAQVGQPDSTQVTIDGANYFVGNSSLMLLKMLTQYSHLLQQIPSLQVEIYQRLMELLQVRSHICS